MRFDSQFDNRIRMLLVRWKIKRFEKELLLLFITNKTISVPCEAWVQLLMQIRHKSRETPYISPDPKSKKKNPSRRDGCLKKWAPCSLPNFPLLFPFLWSIGAHFSWILTNWVPASVWSHCFVHLYKQNGHYPVALWLSPLLTIVESSYPFVSLIYISQSFNHYMLISITKKKKHRCFNYNYY
jgi:hypothetical protein